MCTGQLLVIAASIVLWIAAVSSAVPLPTAPLHLTSIHGRPEHISTSPFNVAVPVVDSVEKLPGACARALHTAKAVAAASAPAASGRPIQPVQRIAVTSAARKRPGRWSRRTG